MRALLRNCLQKQPQNRLHEIADVRIALQDAIANPARASVPAPERASTARRAVIPIVAIAGSAVAAIVVWGLLSSAPRKVAKMSVVLPPNQQFDRTLQSSIAISPDGTLAYVSRGQLHTRKIDESESHPIAGTQEEPLSPVFGPGGQWIAYWSRKDTALKKIAISGGEAITLAPVSYPVSSLSWKAGMLAYAIPNQGVFTVPEDAGTPKLWAKAESGETVDAPHILPGGDAILFAATRAPGADRWDKADIVAVRRGSEDRQILIQGGSSPRYSPTGHLIYALGANLLAVAFDLGNLTIHPGAVPVVEGVLRSVGPANPPPGTTHYDFTDDGTLVYIPQSAALFNNNRQLALADRTGAKQVLNLPPALYEAPRLSPDAKLLAVVRPDDGGSIFIYNLASPSPLRKLITEGMNSSPVWSSDGRWIAFQSIRSENSGIYRQLADGSAAAEKLVTLPPNTGYRPTSWSANALAFTLVEENELDISTISLSGSLTSESSVQSVVNMPKSLQFGAALSPNGRLMAYVSNEDGPYEIFIQPFPTGARQKITQGLNANAPVWSRTGNELYYYQDGKIFVVDIQPAAPYISGTPTPLKIEGIVQGAGGPVPSPTRFDVTMDGKFLVLVPAPAASGSPIQQANIVQNWFDELEKRVCS